MRRAGTASMSPCRSARIFGFVRGACIGRSKQLLRPLTVSKELAQNGAPRGRFLARFEDARHALCAPEELAQNGARRGRFLARLKMRPAPFALGIDSDRLYSSGRSSEPRPKRLSQNNQSSCRVRSDTTQPGHSVTAPSGHGSESGAVSSRSIRPMASKETVR